MNRNHRRLKKANKGKRPCNRRNRVSKRFKVNEKKG